MLARRPALAPAVRPDSRAESHIPAASVPSLEQAAHPILRDKAYAFIKAKILNHELQPGERIREDLLARELSMSRTPVREAINQLTAEGLIVTIPRKGLFCITLTREEILELLAVREALEVLAVEKCVERITPEQLERLAVVLREHEQAFKQRRFAEASERDSRFHREIAAVSGSRKLIEFINELEEVMRVARAMELAAGTERQNARTPGQHRAIYERIKARDTTGAVAAVRENIRAMRVKLGG